MDPAQPTAYDILGLAPPAADGAGPTDADIRRAFRRLALTKHPDKQPDNPRAAAEFDEIQKAYAVLTDGEARAALDGLLAARAAAAARDAERSDKRRRMAADLDAREKAAAAGGGGGVRPPPDDPVARARARLAAELERLRKKADAEAAARPAPPPPPPPPPPLDDDIDRTVKLSWALADGDYTANDLKAALAAVPTAIVTDVVLRAAKKRGTGSALVTLASRDGAVAAAAAPLQGAHGPILVVPLRKGGGVPGRDVGVAATKAAVAPAAPAPLRRPAPGGRPVFAAGAASGMPAPQPSPFPSFASAPAAQPASATDREADVLARMRAAGKKE